VASVRREGRCVRTVHGPVDRHRRLLVERLFLLRLRRVEGEAGGTLDVGDGNRLLGTGLVHGDGSRPALPVVRILRLGV